VNPRFLPHAAVARSQRRAPSDARLVELARTGSEPAFEAIVARYRLPLVRHCARMVGDADAEDAAQDALLNAHAALVRGAAVRQLAPWLYAIAQNTARNCLRARAARPATEDADRDGGACADGSAEDRQELREVLAAVSSLPDRQRDAIVMREFEGRSYEEIASRLGASHGAVRQLLNRARGSVRERVRVLVPVAPLVRWALSRSSGATGAGGATLSGACILGAKVCVVALLPATVALTAPGPPHHTLNRSPNSVTRRIHIRAGSMAALAATAATGPAAEERLRSASTSRSADTRSLGTDRRARSTTNTPVRGRGSRHASAANGDRSAGRGAARRPWPARRQNIQTPAAVTTPTSTPSHPADPRTIPPDSRTVPPDSRSGPRAPVVSSDSPSTSNPHHAHPAGVPGAGQPPQSPGDTYPPGSDPNAGRGTAAPSSPANSLTQPTPAPSAGSGTTVGGRPGPRTPQGTSGSGDGVRPSSPSPAGRGDSSAPQAAGVSASGGEQSLPGASDRLGGSGSQPAGGPGR